MKSPVRLCLREENCVRLIGMKGFHRRDKMFKQWGVDSCDPAAVLTHNPGGIGIFVAANDGVICGDDMRYVHVSMHYGCRAIAWFAKP